MNGFVIGRDSLGRRTQKLFNIKDNYKDVPLKEGLKRKFIFICYKSVEGVKAIVKQIYELGFRPIIIIRSDCYPGFTQSLKDKYGMEFIHYPDLPDKNMVVIGSTGNQQVVNAVENALFKNWKVHKMITTATTSEYIVRAWRILNAK